MKQLILIISLFVTLSLSAQDAKVVREVNMCETGTEKAISNFNLGIYNLYAFGWAPQPTDDFEAFYNKHLLEKYSISIVSMGCVIMPGDECYEKKMKELLLKKYGDDIFDKARSEAKLAFKAIKN